MRSETYEIYLFCIGVKPYKKEITFNVTFHIALIIPAKSMGIMFLRNWFFIGELLENFIYSSDFHRVITKSLIILLILG